MSQKKQIENINKLFLTNITNLETKPPQKLMLIEFV